MTLNPNHHRVGVEHPRGPTEPQETPKVERTEAEMTLIISGIILFWLFTANWLHYSGGDSDVTVESYPPKLNELQALAWPWWVLLSAMYVSIHTLGQAYNALHWQATRIPVVARRRLRKAHPNSGFHNPDLIAHIIANPNFARRLKRSRVIWQHMIQQLAADSRRRQAEYAAGRNKP